MNTRILITGAAGFIGSNLADRLLKSGISIMGIDNFDSFYDRANKEKNISGALADKFYEFREGDIRDADFIKKCFLDFKPDIIVHLAAKAGVRPSLTNPELYFDVNIMGTMNILEMMRKCSIKKMIFASSSSVYGNNSKIPFSENDNVDYPVSPYAASKKAGELLCHTYHHLYNLDIFCLRFFTVYGPRQRPDLAIHKFLKALFAEEVIYLYGDGTTSRDYTHIYDIIRGICGAIDKVNGFNIFNLGNANPVSLIDLVKLMEKLTGRKSRLEYLPMQEGDVLRTFADISKSRIELDYYPEIDIETGLKNFLEWFREYYFTTKTCN
jgi:UDP-glucuronate 4-epimerase